MNFKKATGKGRDYKDLINLSYEECHDLAVTLAKDIIDNTIFADKPTVLVPLARGGLVPGVVMAHETGYELEPVYWQTRDGQRRYVPENVLQKASEGYRLIVVDDINDSGKTLADFVAHIKSLSPSAKIYSAVLVEQTQSKHTSTWAGLRVDTKRWFGFPWEKAV